MGTVSQIMLRTFSFAHLQPDADYGALGLTIYHASPQQGEPVWIAAVAERGRREGVEEGGRIIEQNPLPLPRLSEVVDWEGARLTQQAALFREHTSSEPTVPRPVEKPTTIEGMYPSEHVESNITSSFQDVWNDRVIMAMKRRPDVRRRAVHTVWWSRLYDVAVQRGDTLSTEQREAVMSERQQLCERVRSFIDIVSAPINQNTNIHDIYISMAALEALDYGTLILAGQGRLTRMFAAIERLSRSGNLDMRYCSTITLSSLAYVLRGKINEVSASFSAWASTMRVLRRHSSADAERNDMMAVLVKHVIPLISCLERRGAAMLKKTLFEISADDFSDAVMFQVEAAQHALGHSRPRYSMVSKSP